MNAITNLAFKAIFGLSGFACSILFYSMWNDIGFLKSSADTVNSRLIKIETQLMDQKEAYHERKEAQEKRDKEIDEAILEIKRNMK